MKLFKIIMLLLITLNIKAQIVDTSNKPLIDSATMYLTGTFKPYNPTKAFLIFMQRASNGDAKAMNAVAIQYAKGVGVDSNFNQAVYWFNQAVSNGYKKALVNLGMIYKHKAIDSTGYAIAFNIFNDAVNINEPSAFFAKGYMLYKGLGCTQSYTDALQLFRRGIDSNRADCMYFAGLCYNNGYGVNANSDSANYFINKAALLGYKQANATLAIADTTTPIAARGTIDKKIKNIINENTETINEQFTNIPITTTPINLDGTYTGILTQYDYSGKQVIKQTKLTLNLINSNGKVVGDWVQNNTTHLPISAVLHNNSLVFDNVQIGKTRNRYQQGTRNEKLLFKSANFQYQKHNDSIMLVGSLQLFQNYQNEPDKPINIVLLHQNKLKDNTKPQTLNDVLIYPNPINDLFNVSITMQQETSSMFSICTQTGKQVFQQNQHLQKGKQIIPINVKLSQGVYIIKINTEKETISRILIKAN